MLKTDNQHIGIVTVLYNGADVLPDFFRTLGEQTYGDFTLYVVDNASTDTALADARRLAEKAPFKCVFLPQSSNLGVAAGNNIGIRAAVADKCPLVLLSNNDIILQPDAIENLYKGLYSEGADMAVPKIYYADTEKLIWCAGGKFQYIQLATAHRGEKVPDSGQFDTAEAVEYAPTCFMLIKAEVFEKVGLMDEKYFVYFDDTDFVWRAVKDNGMKLFYIPQSVIEHKVSVSTGGAGSDFSIKYFHRNHVYFALKHASVVQKLIFIPYLIYNYLKNKYPRMNSKQRKLVRNSYIMGWKLYNER